MGKPQGDDPLARVIRTLHTAADDPDLTDADRLRLMLVVRDGIRELRAALEAAASADDLDAVRALAQSVLDRTSELAPKG